MHITKKQPNIITIFKIITKQKIDKITQLEKKNKAYSRFSRQNISAT